MTDRRLLNAPPSPLLGDIGDVSVEQFLLAVGSCAMARLPTTAKRRLLLGLLAT